MECGSCGGLLSLLGTLGALAWFRCVNCGGEFHYGEDEVDMDEVRATLAEQEVCCAGR